MRDGWVALSPGLAVREVVVEAYGLTKMCVGAICGGATLQIPKYPRGAVPRSLSASHAYIGIIWKRPIHISRRIGGRVVPFHKVRPRRPMSATGSDASASRSGLVRLRKPGRHVSVPSRLLRRLDRVTGLDRRHGMPPMACCSWGQGHGRAPNTPWRSPGRSPSPS